MSKYKNIKSKNLTNLLKYDNDEYNYNDFDILDGEKNYIDSLFDDICHYEYELYILNKNKPDITDYDYYDRSEYYDDFKNWLIEKQKLKFLCKQSNTNFINYEHNFKLKKKLALETSENINRLITDNEYTKFKEDERRYKIEYNFSRVLDEIKDYVKNMLLAKQSFYSKLNITLSHNLLKLEDLLYKNIIKLYKQEKSINL